jgi:recombination DNA repair RAD52 pathway protein
MQSDKSVTELPITKKIRTCIGDQHDYLECGLEHEALVSLANETFGLYAWSHSVTHQNIGMCVVVAELYILKL